MATNATTSASNSFDALNTLVDEDDCGGTSTKEPKQVERNGKKDINTSVPSSSYYKPPISVVSSHHGSSPVAYGSPNTTPLVERINKIEKKMLDRKLMVMDDIGKLLNKVDSNPVDSYSESEVEAAYDEAAQFRASEGANDTRLYEDKDYDIYATYDIEGLTKQQVALSDMM
nr:hypothetical protein [Tanacetum cinerariifolium]